MRTSAWPSDVRSIPASLPRPGCPATCTKIASDELRRVLEARMHGVAEAAVAEQDDGHDGDRRDERGAGEDSSERAGRGHLAGPERRLARKLAVSRAAAGAGRPRSGPRRARPCRAPSRRGKRIATRDGATPARRAISLRSASFARPSTGGAVTRTAYPPSGPEAIRSRAARGVRRTRMSARGATPRWSHALLRLARALRGLPSRALLLGVAQRTQLGDDDIMRVWRTRLRPAHKGGLS